jgi:phosphoglycolate phosphatase
MTPAIDSLILDLDGTLLDSRPGVVNSFCRAAKVVFPIVDLDAAKVPVGPPIRRICTAVFPAISEEELERMTRAYRAHYDSEGCLQTRLYEGALELLSECGRRHIPIDVATNKPQRVTTSILSRLEIDRFFRSVVAVDSADPPFAGKSAILKHLMTLNRLNLERTLYVGDTAEDAAAAQTCGIRFVWAAYGYGKLEGGEEVFRTINKLAELRQIL